MHDITTVREQSLSEW